MTDTIHPIDPAPLLHSRPAVAVHIALRREFRLAGPLVRRCAAHDAARARVVARHLEFLVTGLHHHHDVEESIVAPIVRSRAVHDDCPAVDVMQSQHDEIAGAVDAVSRALPAWSTDPSAAARDRLAELLDALHGLLVVHLDVEERSVLPLAERHLTTQEWAEIGRRAEAGLPARERALSFGMIQYEGDPEVVAAMLAPAPLPVRVLVPLLARRAYRRHALEIHGTATP